MQNSPLKRNAPMLTQREQKECADHAAKSHPAKPDEGAKRGTDKTLDERAKPKTR